ncbi:MAG: phosphatase PAP2 family protein [Candidatus Nanohaloarchaea archaeon]
MRKISRSGVDTLAGALSLVFNPFATSIGGGLLLVELTGLPARPFLEFVVLGIAVVVLPTYIAVKSAERFYGYDLYVREERTLFYVLAMLFSTVFLLLAAILNAPVVFQKLAYAGIAAIAAGAAGNEYVKPSIHAGVLSGVAATAAFYSTFAAAVVFLLLAAVGWSRIRLEQHTARDVIAGALIAAASVTVAFLLV